MTQEELNKKLIYTSVRGNTEQVREMLDAGADPNTKDNDGHTALIEAAWRGKTETARLLLEAGADPNIRDDKNRTALIWAAGFGHTEFMKLLVEAGAETDIKNKYGDTTFDILKEQYPDKYRQWVQVSAVKARKENLAREDSADNNSHVPDYEI